MRKFKDDFFTDFWDPSYAIFVEQVYYDKKVPKVYDYDYGIIFLEYDFLEFRIKSINLLSVFVFIEGFTTMLYLLNRSEFVIKIYINEWVVCDVPTIMKYAKNVDTMSLRVTFKDIDDHCGYFSDYIFYICSSDELNDEVRKRVFKRLAPR
jgi:hypothetical protein